MPQNRLIYDLTNFTNSDTKTKRASFKVLNSSILSFILSCLFIELSQVASASSSAQSFSSCVTALRFSPFNIFSFCFKTTPELQSIRHLQCFIVVLSIYQFWSIVLISLPSLCKLHFFVKTSDGCALEQLLCFSRTETLL